MSDRADIAAGVIRRVANQSRRSYERSSAVSDVSLAPFGLCIVRAMQASASCGERAGCVANRSSSANRRARLLASRR